MYKIILGRDITAEVNQHLQDGWNLVGGLTCTTKGSVVEFAQAMYKEIETPVETPVAKKPARRKAK